ncbi:MAG TPA: FecR domain-containing protein [Tenuifilaceae bacterium]|nr:FecR domain-containing protein [Tenuifilaceae bacterium]
MINSTPNTQDYKKISRYLCDDMLFPERLIFLALVACKPRLRKNFKAARMDMAMADKLISAGSYNPNVAWEKLHDRLENESLIPDEIRNTVTFYKGAYLKYAAIAALAILLIGIPGYFLFSPSRIVVENGRGGSTMITSLPDGTSVYLAENSTLSYPKHFKGKLRSVTLNGEAFFEVAPNPHKPFIVNTKAATVRVLGTTFNIKSTDSNNFELCVVEGKVKVSSLGGDVLATAGERVYVRNSLLQKSISAGQPTVKHRMTRLQFQDERMEDIVGIINRTYGSNIELMGNNLRNRRISVTFENELSSIVSILSASFNLQIETEPDGTIVLSEKSVSP